MTNLFTIFNFSAAASAVVMGIVCLSFSLTIFRDSEHYKKFFIGFFSVFIIYGVFYLLSQVSLLYQGSNIRILSMIALFCQYFFSSLLSLLFSAFLVRYLESRDRSDLYFQIVFGLWCAFVLILAFAQFTTLFYYVNSANEYITGPLYPVLLAPILLMLITNLFAIIGKRKRLAKKEFTAFLGGIVIPLVFTLIQMFFGKGPAMIIGRTICCFILFMYVALDQSERFIKETELTAKQQVSIMTLQMRPHFIFNTLTSIYYLCASDPAKAQSTIENFTTYLRKNFTSVAVEGVVEFDEELSHTKAYLEVEKVRYEKLLFVDYDITVHGFSLPPLTLQPIVENAVKHGVDPELSPMHLQIRTFKNPRGYYVVVEDNGPGYDESATIGDQRSHIGIENVKNRLRTICNGTLTIAAGEAGGTKATIFIPANIEKNANN